MRNSFITNIYSAKDVYMESEGTRCLRAQQVHDTDILMSIDYAKAECSKNRRCVAVEHDDDTGLFRACLDAIYASTGAEKYQTITYKLLKKVESYGKYTFL